MSMLNCLPITFRTLLAGSLLAVTPAQSLSYSIQSIPGGPSARAQGGFVFDESRDRWVLFSGQEGPACSQFPTDTWTFDGSTWRQLSLPGLPPTGRRQPVMVYDRVRNLVVLFGGQDCNGNLLADTWVLDAVGWHQRMPSVAPSARTGAAAAFDEVRGAVVVHGGGGGSGPTGDTWSWNGVTWQLLTNGPACDGGGMVFDLRRRSLLLCTLGGDSRTYELVGATWVDRAPLASSQSGQTFVYDRRTGWTLSYGGQSGCYGDTSLLVWDGSSWSNGASIGNRPQLASPMLAQRPQDGALTLFGGSSAWCWNSYSSSAYSFLPIRAGSFQAIGLNTHSQSGRTEHAITTNPGGGLLSFGGNYRGVSLDTRVWQNGWQERYPLQTPSWRLGVAMSHDLQRDIVVMFGGRSPLNVDLGDTWLWNGLDWARVVPVTRPTARSRHAMTYDAATATVLLHGGADVAGQFFGDFWRFDGVDWSQTLSPHQPSPRADHALAKDLRRDRVVMVGGSGSAVVRDVWEWNGTDWALVGESPFVSTVSGLAYDPRVERVVVMGIPSCTDQAWSWDGVFWTLHPASLSNRGPMHIAYDHLVGRTLATGGTCNPSDEVYHIQLPTYARNEPYGQGCVGSAGTPALAALPGSNAVTGQTFQMQVSRLPTTFFNFVYGLVGFSSSVWQFGPLPMDLGAVGLPGCSALTSSDQPMVLPLASPQGVSPWNVAVPSQPALLGVHVYFQSLVYDLQPSRWASVSNAIAARIGDA